MNKETFEGKWNILKGKAKEKWGKLTDDDLLRINGKKDQLIGELQNKYGYIKSKAEEEVANWESSCGSCGCGTEHTSSHNKTHNAHNQTHNTPNQSHHTPNQSHNNNRNQNQTFNNDDQQSHRDQTKIKQKH